MRYSVIQVKNIVTLSKMNVLCHLPLVTIAIYELNMNYYTNCVTITTAARSFTITIVTPISPTIRYYCDIRKEYELLHELL